MPAKLKIVDVERTVVRVPYTEHCRQWNAREIWQWRISEVIRVTTDAGIVGNVLYVQADAEHLPFRENFFHCVSIGFGLRNVTHQQIALQSMYRCLRPGGRILVLEFSRPTTKWLRKLYDLYSFNVLPQVGRLVVGDKASYQYLVESIRKQPTQAELQSMMETAGFERVDYHNLSGGIVAVHAGYKF